MNDVNAVLEHLSQAVQAGDIDTCKDLTKKALDMNLDPLVLIEQGLARGLRTVGEAFGRGDLFLTDLMFAAEAMKTAVSLVEPVIESKHERREFRGAVLIGTVEGDIHDIGKSIVAATLEANGFNVTDLGVDVPNSTFLEKSEELKPDIVAMSALLSTTMSQQKVVTESLRKRALSKKVKVMVGAAPVSSDWAAQIGADAYGVDAVDAGRKALELVNSLQ